MRTSRPDPNWHVVSVASMLPAAVCTPSTGTASFVYCSIDRFACWSAPLVSVVPNHKVFISIRISVCLCTHFISYIVHIKMYCNDTGYTGEESDTFSWYVSNQDTSIFR
jgi:hypothetical protein